jgi:2-amino-4-hydroxy-6-hydroxymethyldihydropteridine diphosphokinase
LNRAYIALGANLGDPVATVNAALVSLADLPRSSLAASSSLYRTAPVGLMNQPDFINAVAILETALSPVSLLDELLAIEIRFGRRRSIPNAPRTLDLDLLLHGDTIQADPRLTLPHPRMHLRAFVLVPLLEIAPDIIIPGHGHGRDLLGGVDGDQSIEQILAA